MATVRIGTCSWADEGLLKHWYPRGVSSAEARLRHYAERFDTVEVDSPFYRLPAPEVTARWAERTPPGFVFHVKASAAMTFHEETDSRERAFAEFRAAVSPLEASGKLRGILLQYHPRFTKSRENMEELRVAGELVAPLVPMIEFRHRSWMEPDERADTLSFLEANGLAYVSVDAPHTRASNVMPRVAAATHELAYVRFHGRNWQTWNKRTQHSSERFDWLYGADELQEWVEPLEKLAHEAREVYAMFNNNRGAQAPTSAKVLRGLLDEAGVPATGGIEPESAAATLF
jgi:uncharacterized protein YecE (DUF72 family)